MSDLMYSILSGLLYVVLAPVAGGLLAGLDRKITARMQRRVVAEYIRYLGVGIANLVNIFFPEVIALGGGIANQGETLRRPLRAQVESQEYGSAYTKKHPRIVTCTLGSDAGVIGAALFAAEKSE